MKTKSKSVKHKIACLSGVTDGIGRQVAFILADLGYDLIVIGRNPEKGKELIREIKSLHPTLDLNFFKADMTLVSEAKKTALAIKKSWPTIDILFQSAGIIPASHQLTKEGIEQSFAVSFLTRYILINSLLKNVLASGDKLIISVASPHPGGNHAINFEDINLENVSFSSNNTVRQFQEANDIFALILRDKYSSKGLKIFCINPGIVNTGIHAGWPPLIRILLTRILGPFLMVEPKQAAEMIAGFVNARNQDSGPLISHKGKTLAPVPRILDSSYQKRFIDLMEKLVKNKE